MHSNANLKERRNFYEQSKNIKTTRREDELLTPPTQEDLYMKILRKSSENEMLSEFLRAEYGSNRFSEQIDTVLKKLGFDTHIILSADLQNNAENAQRKKLMGDFRGYGLNKELFENFPTSIEWYLCRFTDNDLKNIRYIDYSYWNELSAGTHAPLIAAETIRKGITIYGESNDNFLLAAEHIKSGGTFPKMFFLTCDFERFVIVEGHLRMTAYALAPEYFNNIEVIVGNCSSDELKNWM